MYENLYWGAGNSNVQDDPNTRLEAYLAAARRSAKVRVLRSQIVAASRASMRLPCKPNAAGRGDGFGDDFGSR